VLAVNLATFPRMFRWMLTRLSRRAEGVRPQETDPRILNLNATRIAFIDSTLLVAGEASALEAVLARLDRGEEPGSAGAGDRAAASPAKTRPLLDPAWRDQFDLYGSMVNRNGSVEALLLKQEASWRSSDLRGGKDWAVERPLAELPPDGELLRARFGIDFRSSDRALAVIEADCASAAGAASWVAVLAERLRYWQEVRLAEHGVRMTVRESTSGTTARVEAELDGLEGWIDSLAAGLFREPGEADRPSPVSR
jgi:hypothetical protein